ncbi:MULTISPECIES: F390 synthetase-related protein [Erwinia]|uniref:F390 synthetase-related protein n=1 Tax=Erwinia TaxID=551 RepID=UPI00143854DA|nr:MULTISPECIES: F390 synthetase-related protein [Erwinia]MCS3609128.1 putative adenylate-forming enzyme [Erwinia rhapontici]NKG28700.1 CoF synthetase [Erwinia rhapontici]NNS09236.1 CoF synthetase [Erwinia sp. JH02]
MIPVRMLWHYFRARRLRFRDRAALERWQARQLQRFARQVMAKSPFYAPFCHLPLSSWPLSDKAQMMTHFDQMNTAGLQVDTLLQCALKSEQDRDFAPKVGRFSVGLSSGTSGRRGVFVVSPREQRIWAGGMLAKMLPRGLLSGERVALFLRADNHLYHSVNTRWLSLAFFDLFAPFSEHLRTLPAFAPTIIVAPAQVLRALALAVQGGQLKLSVSRVISVAEVLEPQDRQLLETVFGDVAEVYQATEGFLAASCSHGRLHLNEEFIHVEPEWIDERRFTPVITDFSRRTQPVIRYRLDDVLVAANEPCPCGQPTRVLEAIEGRRDDQLLLPDMKGDVQAVFADVCSRAIARSLPLTSDYRLVQTGMHDVQLISDADEASLVACQQALIALFAQQGIATERLCWQLSVQPLMPQFDRKRRRIIRQKGEGV